jgi:hypothetical protein
MTREEKERERERRDREMMEERREAARGVSLLFATAPGYIRLLTLFTAAPQVPFSRPRGPV